MVDQKDGGTTAEVRKIETERLPAADTLIEVEYSSLNYKDGLAITGKGKIIRGELPFVPGIDLAGTVESTDSSTLRVGQRVLVTGWGLGEKSWGGFAERARVRGEHAIPIPEGLSTRDAMVLGTAGLTAMLSVLALEDHDTSPDDGEIVVSGASGGVGSVAIACLAARGFRVIASTGSHQVEDYLRRLGASSIIDREELPSAASKPLGSTRWGGAIDTVGGKTLAGIISQLRTHGSVAACGNTGGFALETTVFPFILRGVNLLGIDSNTAPNELRTRAWDRLASDLTDETLRAIEAETVGLGDLPEKAEQITNGRINGRVVVDVRR